MFKEKIDYTHLPKHIAIIMDGNGRWAKEKGYNRIYGHQKGVTSVRRITEAAAESNIQFLTIYTFSTENWNRPSDEIKALMELLVITIDKEMEDLNKNNIRMLTIGDLSKLPNDAAEKIRECKAKTAQNTGLTLNLALSYSSRWEITEAVKNIVCDVEKGKLTSKNISDKLISSYLSTAGIPDPDLMIRTGGELRISNFLLWQSAYTEFYFTSKYWPEFDKEDFYEAIFDFQQRERRFGR
ncbi:MAG TPA: isoprenyl transferase [Paludibacteraceae bacterium]|nr:isoprenyl transferase [Paludibacteraceae bacterium]